MTALDYWCTWSTQGAVADARGPGAVERQRDALDLDRLVGGQGWLHDLPAELRSGLLVVLDDGWDAPRGLPHREVRLELGALAPDPDRFPVAGDTPADRLAAIDRRIRALGYAGTGLWVAAQGRGEAAGPPWPPERQEAYWRERLAWSRDAGIAYWKVDWGVHWNDGGFRRLLTRLAREVAPGLAIEHAVVMPALNDWDTRSPDAGAARGSGRFGGSHAELLRALVGHADVIRTYDASGTHAAAVTLDRVACLLQATVPLGPPTHVNVEGHPLLAAGLGMCAGVMKHPRHWRSGVRPTWDAVRRLLAWRRLAPALPLGAPSAMTAERLESSAARSRMDEATAVTVSIPVRQSAPAVVARGGLAPPRVEATAPCGPPFVAATRHPDGAVAVAALERTLDEHGTVAPPARVALDLGAAGGPLAVFGAFAEVEVRAPALAGRRLRARDPLGGEAAELPAADGVLRLPGGWLERVGRAGATPGDPSPPTVLIEAIP